MRSIDVHTHLLPAGIPRWSEQFGYGGFIRLERKDACTARMVRDDGTFFRDVTSNVWDPGVRIAESNEAEVGVQVLSTVPVMFGYWIPQPRQALDAAAAAFLRQGVQGLRRAEGVAGVAQGPGHVQGSVRVSS